MFTKKLKYSVGYNTYKISTNIQCKSKTKGDATQNIKRGK